MSFTQVTVTHTFQNADGTPASGTCQFKLSGRMTNGTSTIMPAGMLSSPLNASGVLSVSLPANDDTATVPTDAYWLVTIAITGCKEEEYNFVLPHASGSADLFALIGSQSVVQ